ncbi:MAG: FGGY-family carbohydrate kinase [Cyclobacteriaceae bacterium]
MKNKETYFAVLDVGKTNKKVLIFDYDLKIVDRESKKFEEFVDGNTFHDDVEGLKEWFLDTLTKFAKKYSIKAISVTTHGATYILADELGNIAVPEVSYTTEPGEDFHKEFYHKFGNAIQLQQQTCTPNFGALINTAKGVYFSQKHYPEHFKHTKYLLNYPQYFTFLLTGVPCYEHTFVGNHSYFWDYHSMDWSRLTKEMGLSHLLPKTFLKSWEPAGTLSDSMVQKTGLDPNVIVTAGIHDSNSSLLPYLITQNEEFILNSTGTWCVIMHEEEKARFAENELGKVVFYNLNAFSKPVKTAIFLGGFEYEQYTNLLQRIHGDFETPPFNYEIMAKIILEKSFFILPTLAKGTGQFPQSNARIIENKKAWFFDEMTEGSDFPDFLHDLPTALAVLNLSLAIQTFISFERAGMVDGMPVFTEGGFSKNDTYNALLTAFYERSSFFVTNLSEATAFGAAMCARSGLDGHSPMDLSKHIQLKKKGRSEGEIRRLKRLRG